MSAIEQQDSHRPPSDGGMAKEEFIRVGTGNGLCKRKTPEKRMSDYAFREKKSERLSY